MRQSSVRMARGQRTARPFRRTVPERRWKHQLQALCGGVYQDAAEQTECKVCDVVKVSHLYESLAVSENHVTDDFALAGAAACCVCGAGRYNGDASTPTVCVDHRIYGAGNYTSAPGNNSLNPKCDQCEASKFKKPNYQHRRSGNLGGL